jgi:hypothetical protein
LLRLSLKHLLLELGNTKFHLSIFIFKTVNVLLHIIFCVMLSFWSNTTKYLLRNLITSCVVIRLSTLHIDLLELRYRMLHTLILLYLILTNLLFRPLILHRLYTPGTHHHRFRHLDVRRCITSFIHHIFRILILRCYRCL